jgi:uncharacterized protein (TIGR03435 family)
MTHGALARALAAFLWCGMAFGQTTESQPAFEVASVKPNPDGRGREQVESSPISLTIRKGTLGFYILWAYDARRDQIVGPDWLNRERYDIVAKAGGPSTERQLRLMLQTLLAERFKLAFHRETKTLPVYEMLVAKGGARLIESKSGDSANLRAGRLSYEIPHTTLPEFALRLQELGAVDYPVVDRTGIEGTFDITLKFVDGYRPRADAIPGGSTFTILEEQLGLKLELRKVPTEILVIDRAEKIPVAN